MAQAVTYRFNMERTSKGYNTAALLLEQDSRGDQHLVNSRMVGTLPLLSYGPSRPIFQVCANTQREVCKKPYTSARNEIWAPLILIVSSA